MRPYLKSERSPFTTSPSQESVSLVFQKFFSSKAISFYLIGLLVCNVLFFKKLLDPLFRVSGTLAVYAFLLIHNNCQEDGRDSVKKNLNGKYFGLHW